MSVKADSQIPVADKDGIRYVLQQRQAENQVTGRGTDRKSSHECNGLWKRRSHGVVGTESGESRAFSEKRAVVMCLLLCQVSHEQGSGYSRRQDWLGGLGCAAGYTAEE